MIIEYLKAKGNKIDNPIVGKSYRVIGRITFSGSIFEVEAIDELFIYLRGYIKPFDIGSIEFYEI